jgi:proline iminopeptidase
MSSDLYFRTLKPLEERFTIVYLDSRGTGRSQRAASSTDYTWDHLVADLEALRAHLRQQRVWLMGHSEGGTYVLHYACKYPERVGGLVLLTTSGVQDEQHQQDVQARTLLRRDQPWFAEAASTMKAAMQKGLPLFYSDVGKLAEHREHFEATSVSVDARRAQNASKRSPFDLTERLKRVHAPALIVVGDEDVLSSPVAANRLHRCLPNSKLLLIEQAGHFPWLEQPRTFFAEVPLFLDALARGTEASRRR